MLTSVLRAGFTGTYTITDANSDAVTVTESIDGVQIRSLVATLGQAITYGVTENNWLALPNGSHTLTIRATDGIDSAVRTYTFTKLVGEFHYPKFYAVGIEHHALSHHARNRSPPRHIRCERIRCLLGKIVPMPLRGLEVFAIRKEQRIGAYFE